MTKKSAQAKGSSYLIYAGAAVALIVVLAIWVSNGLILIYHPGKSSMGDIFGGSSSLFSGLALVGVFVAVFLQREELRETKRSLRAERFEGTYFKLFEMHRRFVDEVRLSHMGKTYRGQKALDKAYTLFRTELVKQDEPLSQNQVGEMFGRFLHDSNSVQRVLGPYLRSSQNILRLVAEHFDVSDYEDIAKKSPDARAYRNVFRDYLSEAEECLLFYNQVHRNLLDDGVQREDYISMLHVLRNLNTEALANPAHVKFPIKTSSTKDGNPIADNAVKL